MGTVCVEGNRKLLKHVLTHPYTRTRAHECPRVHMPMRAYTPASPRPHMPMPTHPHPPTQCPVLEGTKWAQGTEQVTATPQDLPCHRQESPDVDSPTECVAILPITLLTDEQGMEYPAVAILRNYDRSLRPIAGKVEEGATHREAIRREMLEEALT